MPSQEESADQQDLLETHRRRLHILQKQAAAQGSQTPPHILIEIEDLQAKINGIKPIAKLPSWGMHRSLFGVVVMLLILIALIAFLYLYKPPKQLWTFDIDLAGWQHEQPGDGRQVAKDIGLFQRGPGDLALRGDFDFGKADPNKLAAGEEPRATFFVDNVEYHDWTQYQVLTLNAMSPTQGSLKIYISIITDNCWYELGDWKNLISTWQTYRFDLTQAKYKTCKHPGTYNNPPDPFTSVRRLDIIIGTNEDKANWNKAQGSILIDNIRLEAKK